MELSESPGAASPDAAFCARALDAAALQFEGFIRAYDDPLRIPRSVKDGVVRKVAPEDWTSGFVAGSLWLLYEHTRAAAFRAAAEAFTAALAAQRARTDTHDLGFVVGCSFGNGLRLTENSDYRLVLGEAARSLATRFNPRVGALRSWSFGSWRFPVIIDNMMNLELLLRASELEGSAALRELAVAHALTTQKNHFRDDASSYHLVDYDPLTGAVLERQTNQGLHDESAWARGQAWGLYGFTMCYRLTSDERFLAQAQRIADFYVTNPRLPADGVPYFDFDAPLDDEVLDHRDASAGAIAASALLELAGFVRGAAGERYRAFALTALGSLASPAYRAPLGANGHFLLMHSVGNYPLHDEVDVAINYADYYYLEGLLRGSRLGRR